jgi:N-glycosylase/DNA lyase
MLMKIKGIGPKVAACTLLFGFDRTDAFPVDVWVKRVIEKYFPAPFDAASLGAYAGLAQQYLFYYERYLGGQK